VTADSTDDSESSSKNHSNHSSDQLGAAAAANMASQFEQASQQQLQHKVCIIPHDVLFVCVCVCAFLLLWSFLFAFSNSSIRFSCALAHGLVFPIMASCRCLAHKRPQLPRCSYIYMQLLIKLLATYYARLLVE
jgi:hypothetical protein